MEGDNFDLMFESIMSARKERVALRFSSTRDWFRKRYDKLQELVDTYKNNPSLSVEFGDTAYGLIAKLAENDGVKRRDGGLLTDRDIGDNLSSVRSERGLANTKVAPHPTSVRAVAKRSITGGRVRPGKASASPNSSTEVVVEVATQSKAVNPDPIVEDIRVAQARYDKEKLSREKLYFLGEDRYILMEVFYPCYLEQRNRYPGKGFWAAVIDGCELPSSRNRGDVRHIRKKIENSNLWDEYKNL